MPPKPHIPLYVQRGIQSDKFKNVDHHPIVIQPEGHVKREGPRSAPPVRSASLRVEGDAYMFMDIVQALELRKIL